MKVISLVPSITELLIYLNVDVVGRTKFCVFPEGKVETIPKIGGTKDVNVSKIIALNPDLVIANKEENVKEQVVKIAEADVEVLTTEIANFEEAIAAILDIGKHVDRKEQAGSLVEKIKRSFQKIKLFDKTVCYLIWKSPYMTVGGDTYINSMLEKCGLKNVFSEARRYPVVTINDIIAAGPDLVFLSSEPYPFSEKHLEEFQSNLPQSRILLVDGTFFSWYGSRLFDVSSYSNKIYIDNLSNI